MKDQFNSFAKKIEEIPKLKSEAHFVINDAAGHVLKGQPLNDSDNNSLNSIFIELQDLDKDIVFYLLNVKSTGVISTDEFLVVSSCFLATKQIGPESSNIRDIFYNKLIKTTFITPKFYIKISNLLIQ